MIDENKLIEDIIPILNKHNDMYLVGKVIGCIDAQPKVCEWIPCSERLPEEFELVLIQNIFGVMSVASRIKDSWFNFQGTELCEAIVWIPLPEPYGISKI